MKQIFLTKLFLLIAAALAAQIKISGRVSDPADGSGLPGVTVQIKKTSVGTISDAEGNYRIEVPSRESILIFSFTGYSPQEIVVGDRTVVDVALGENTALIEQVVVVGYGKVQKSDLTGAVGTLKAKEIERVATPNIAQALQGKIAGVYVSPESGEPGKGATIRVRGTGTLNNASPIFVVDGMILEDANFVNPQDIASIEVLKDASATAIYGNRGSNGVIIITTKQGSRDRKAVISLSTYFGRQEISKKLELANASEFAQMINEQRGNTNTFPDPSRLGAGTDWQDVIFRNAPIANVQLSAGGTFRKLNYNLSGNYFDQQGIQEKTGFRRYTGRFNGEYSVLKNLKLSANIAHSSERSESVGGGVLGGVYRMPPVFAERDSTGKFSDPTFFGLSIGNPAASLFYLSDQHTDIRRTVGTLAGDWTFLKNFTFRSSFGFDRRNDHFFYFEPKYEVTASQLNILEKTTRDTATERTWLWENTLNFQKKWDAMRLDAVVGQSAQEFTYTKVNTVNGILQPNGRTFRDWAMVSFLGRANVSFFDRYLLTASMRADGSSRFAKGNRWGYFPSAAVGWNVAQEPFMDGQNLFDRLKIRASWGITGNDKIQNYPSLGVITDELYSAFNDTVQPGATLVNYANADIRWETTRQTDVGLEIALFDGRFSLEADWFRRFTFDILGDLPIPDYVGSGSNPFVNAAEVENRGFDFTLQWRETRKKFTYNLGAILSPLHNEVLRLNDGKSEIFDGSTAQGDFATRTIVGLPIGAFYGYQVAGVFQNADEIAASPNFGNEKPGDFRFADLSGDGKLDAKDRTYLGSPIPTLTYGFSAGFEVSGFDFAADFFGVSGNKVVNAKAVARFDTPNWERIWYENRWTGEGTSNSVPRVTNGGHNYRMSDFLIEDGSFLRLRSIVVGYSLPARWLKNVGMRQARFYASATNWWTRQSYSGFSPEFPNSRVFEAGVDRLTYPMARTLFFGLNASL